MYTYNGYAIETWDEVSAYCESKRECDGFCWKNSSCSGPTYSNKKSSLDVASMLAKQTGKKVYALEGGSCTFYVEM